ncbi:MAG: hypothetical protein K8R75_08725 [Deltaproteobacteria bacterium]|nr:hypothetical protein [Deltaproteobacteria bacterium]
MNENHVNLIHPVREVLPKAAKFSKMLKRDYKNVHQDVHLLKKSWPHQYG